MLRKSGRLEIIDSVHGVTQKYQHAKISFCITTSIIRPFEIAQVLQMRLLNNY